MNRKLLIGLLALVGVAITCAAAWAGSSGGPPGNEGGGGGGAEPETIALVLFSILPGAWLAHRAAAGNRKLEER